MLVCLCKGVSDRKIKELIAGGCSTLRDIVHTEGPLLVLAGIYALAAVAWLTINPDQRVEN